MNIEQLNDRFAIEGQLDFTVGKGGFPMIEVHNAKARALISLYGGQVLAYCPADGRELLFVSEQAYFEPGKAIKGGIPVCWPWFGDDPEDQGRGAHGFVRNRDWQVAATGGTPDGDTRVRLTLQDDEHTRRIWPHPFLLELEIRIGATLALTLTTHNRGSEAFPLTQALHSYFAVGDIDAVAVTGLDGRSYLDKAAGWARKQQQGEVRFRGEVDRVYLAVPSRQQIEDGATPRKISIYSEGNQTLVVWNPGALISRAMADLRDDDYRRFVCVETANAVEDIVTLPAGEHYSLAAEYAIL